MFIKLKKTKKNEKGQSGSPVGEITNVGVNMHDLRLTNKLYNLKQGFKPDMQETNVCILRGFGE